MRFEALNQLFKKFAATGAFRDTCGRCADRWTIRAALERDRRTKASDSWLASRLRSWMIKPRGWQTKRPALSSMGSLQQLAAHHATGARESEEVMEVREVRRQAHLKQPLGSRVGYRTRQRGGSGLKSTTGGSRGGSSGMGRAGGVLHQITSKGPHEP